MDNLTDTIGNILSDPEAMKKIQALSKSLGLSGSPAPEKAPQNENTSFPDMGMLSNLMSGISEKKTEPPQNPMSAILPQDGEMMSKLMSFLPLLSNINKEDESTRLLDALRPFLSEHKRKRLDEASKIMRIMRFLPMLRGTGLLP